MRDFARLVSHACEQQPWQTDALLDAADMLDENAKLRESVSSLLTQRDERLATAESENAKLRELAKQMYVCLTRPKVYDGEHPYLIATECPYFTEGACDYNACGFERRMRETGVEVDE